MEVGQFIKLHCIKQKITQEALAQGIVSMSYLSKIENQRTTASPEVVSILCARLGVQYSNKENAEMKEKYKNWFKLLFEVNDKEEIIAKHDEIQKKIVQTNETGTIMFEIHKIDIIK